MSRDYDFEYQQHLRQRAIKNLRHRLRRDWLIYLLPIHLIIYVIGYELIAPAANGSGDFLSQIAALFVIAWSILLVMHMLAALIKVVWEFFVHREMRRLRRQEEKTRPAITWHDTPKGKRISRLASDGELVPLEDLDQASESINDNAPNLNANLTDYRSS